LSNSGNLTGDDNFKLEASMVVRYSWGFSFTRLIIGLILDRLNDVLGVLQSIHLRILFGILIPAALDFLTYKLSNSLDSLFDLLMSIIGSKCVSSSNLSYSLCLLQ